MDIIAGLVWLSVIFAPDGSYTGQQYVTDSLASCQRAVEYARKAVPPGFTVISCTSVGVASERPQEGPQAP